MFAEDQDSESFEVESEENETQSSSSRWYAVQVASGCEKKVKANLEQRIKTLDVQDLIYQIEIPQTPTVKIRKDGSRQTAQEKVFPGYVLIKMNMDDDAWQVIKNTPHVINFVGTEQKRPYGRGRGVT
jgi:transcriptional antiterminator NusG